MTLTLAVYNAENIGVKEGGGVKNDYFTQQFTQFYTTIYDIFCS